MLRSAGEYQQQPAFKMTSSGAQGPRGSRVRAGDGGAAAARRPRAAPSPAVCVRHDARRPSDHPMAACRAWAGRMGLRGRGVLRRGRLARQTPSHGSQGCGGAPHTPSAAPLHRGPWTGPPRPPRALQAPAAPLPRPGTLCPACRSPERRLLALVGALRRRSPRRSTRRRHNQRPLHSLLCTSMEAAHDSEAEVLMHMYRQRQAEMDAAARQAAAAVPLQPVLSLRQGAQPAPSASSEPSSAAPPSPCTPQAPPMAAAATEPPSPPAPPAQTAQPAPRQLQPGGPEAGDNMSGRVRTPPLICCRVLPAARLHCNGAAVCAPCLDCTALCPTAAQTKFQANGMSWRRQLTANNLRRSGQGATTLCIGIQRAPSSLRNSCDSTLAATAPCLCAAAGDMLCPCTQRRPRPTHPCCPAATLCSLGAERVAQDGAGRTAGG